MASFPVFIVTRRHVSLSTQGFFSLRTSAAAGVDAVYIQGVDTDANEANRMKQRYMSTRSPEDVWEVRQTHGSFGQDQTQIFLRIWDLPVRLAVCTEPTPLITCSGILLP